MRTSIKQFLPRTLFGRSLLILIMPVLLIQIVTTFVFFDRHWSRVLGRLSYATAGEVAVLVDVLERYPGSEIAEQIAALKHEYLRLEIRFQRAKVLDTNEGDYKAFFWEAIVAQALRRELENHLEQPFLLNIDFSQKRAQILVQLETGVLEVILPQKRLFSSSGYIFLLWVFGSSILLLMIAVIFMRNQIRPIRKLSVAAKRMGQGRDVPSFKPEGAREVRQASQAFIDMHRRINRQVSQRTAMLAGVSHDLRTPLTRLKLALAMIESKDAEAMKSDIDEMERMIDGYLDFVRGEGGEGTKITDLTALFHKLLDDLERQGIDVSADIQTGLQAMIRPMGLERCLSNLLVNAGKYGQHVWMQAMITEEMPGEKRLVIAIEDDGPGIPQAQYDEVFKPFYRLDESRNIDTGGVGLGMPIAMDIVHAHGGRIWLEKSPQHGGLCVNIRIPV